MALDKDFDRNNDIAQFLEKFKEQPFAPQADSEPAFSQPSAPSVRPTQYARSFEKLEQKIHELEERFEASTTQNQLILSELARTREVMERQKDKDAFLEHLSRTIATLRTSVENLSHTQYNNSFNFRPTQRSFDPLPEVFPGNEPQTPSYAYPDLETQSQLQYERAEQTRRFNSLRQKASQLKAVNSALDREIKKAQQEKMDALKKSADQAREILSLRDQLSAAEERFKSFDFEGRIISIKQEYQQKVTNLENRLKEMSDTCMKHVEEIESLKVENTKLQNASAQKEALKAQLAHKEQELVSIKNTIASLQSQNSGEHTKRLVAFTAQLRTLEEQRDRLAVELEQSQMSLETMRREKDMLEKNFKELVVKINQNDTVIEQLKQKIEVLGNQNTQLNQHNEELSQVNTVLSQDNASLSQSNVELTHRNAALTQRNEQLASDNKQLSERTKKLEEEISTSKGHVEKLREDNRTFAQEAKKLDAENKMLREQREQVLQKNATSNEPNEALSAHDRVNNEQDQYAPLHSQNAALLAARVVQEHNQKQAQQQVRQFEEGILNTSDQLRETGTPMMHSLGRRIPLSSKRTEEDWEMVSAKVTIPAERKVHIQTPDDLPEIKVVQSPAPDVLFDGEDFLEKTGSFIGRMKWSIFRENH